MVRWHGPWRQLRYLVAALVDKLGRRWRGERARRRPLSIAEMQEARQIFGTSIDLGRVTIEHDSLYDLGCSCAVGNTIALTDDQLTADGATLSHRGMQTLIHELAHVWQYQHQGWGYVPGSLWAQLVATVQTGSRNAAYDWRRLEDRGIPWRRWNPEAQAQAVEDFYEARRHLLVGGDLWHRQTLHRQTLHRQTLERTRPHVERMRSPRVASRRS